MTVTRTLWNGATIPALGLGCWAIGGPAYRGDAAIGWGKVDDNESLAAIERGVELGIRFFDTANVYGGGHSEDVLGEALRRYPDVMVATKVGGFVDPVTRQAGEADRTPAGIVAAAEASLKRLRRDCIDLYLLHVNALPIEAALPIFETMQKLKESGKIGAYGWSTDFPDRAAAYADRPDFVAVEHAMNVFFRAEAVTEAIAANDLVSIVRSPLAMGLLTGKYRAGETGLTDDVRASNLAWLDYFKDGKVVPAFAARLAAVRDLLQSDGRTLAQGALAWLWARSDRTIPVPGFRTVAQVDENVGALAKGPLSGEIMEEIETLIAREPEGPPRER